MKTKTDHDKITSPWNIVKYALVHVIGITVNGFMLVAFYQTIEKQISFCRRAASVHPETASVQNIGVGILTAMEWLVPVAIVAVAVYFFWLKPKTG